MKRIILTGGGTAGHVTPNIALIPKLQDLGYDVHYIGSYNGMEKKLIEDMKIPYHGISSGKLRRYFDPKNFSDPFKVIKGYSEASKLIKTLKPDVIFSKGGFVTVPVVIAAKRHGIPALIHESDMTPGLANRICIPCATKVCCNFPETVKYIKDNKGVLTGTPIRQELFNGNKEKGLDLCKFNKSKPVLLIIGGSTGSLAINKCIWDNLDDILAKYQVIHICGKGNINESVIDKSGYIQFEYVKRELTHLLAACNIIISRAGANAICELLALRKPNILIPLSASASRGDQILNSASFEKQGYSYVIKEENLSKDTLLSALDTVSSNKELYIDAMKKSEISDSIATITSLIESVSK